MRHRFAVTLLAGLLLASAWGPVSVRAQAPEDRVLVIGTKEAAPFVVRSPDGSWSGISIELWREIADELELDFRLVERDLEGLIEGVATGELDGAVAALTVTAEREERVDFTHPFYTSGLGIAVPAVQKSGFLMVMERLFSLAFLRVLGALIAVLLLAAVLVWVFERRANPEQFGGPTAKGLGSAFWWSAVTMTTVGYGDKAPKTTGGRTVALIWMFTSVVIISGFTAAIASALTVGQLASPVQGPEDLPRVRVATVGNSTSERYLADRHVMHTAYPDASTALQALADGQVDAVVYDAPILQYRIAQDLKGEARVLPRTFERQDYAIALTEGNPLREPISRILLRKIGEPGWQDLLFRYLGS